MFDTFRNAWKIADLRKKLLYTFMIIVIFRLGCAIPVPYIAPEGLQAMVGAGQDTGNMFNYLNMLSGGAFSQATLFALGVTPYINASIIIQLLTVAIPALERLAQEGEEGRKKINRITRYVGAAIAILLSVLYYFLLRNRGTLLYTEGAAGTFSAIVIVLAFAAGSLLIQWLGEQIDTKGIGNGVSIIIFAGIVSGWSSIFSSIQFYWQQAATSPKYYIFMPLLLILAIVAIVFIVILNAAERRIPVQYAKRVVGHNKMYGGQHTHIPIKVNMSGVMPVIFASAFVSIPGTLGTFFPNLADSAQHPVWSVILNTFRTTGFAYAIIYLLLIVGFNYFYVAIQYNPVEIANNLRNNSGTIPGYRPGKPTSDFITKVLSKITFIGAAFLGIVAISPIVLSNVLGMSISLGGTSLLIVVGVALETSRSLESYMLMRHHKGFLE